jgi:hypothetical protein
MSIGRGVVAVIVGMIAGMILMNVLHFASTTVYPVPEDVDMYSTEPAERKKVAAWVETLPAGAFVWALLAHGLGAMSGAAVATLLAKRRSLVPGLVVGALFTIGGIFNLMAIPHPTWFMILDVPIYLVLAYLAGRWLRRPDGAE